MQPTVQGCRGQHTEDQGGLWGGARKTPPAANNQRELESTGGRRGPRTAGRTPTRALMTRLRPVGGC